MKTVLILAAVVAAFLVAARGDKQVMDAERAWCIEASYTGATVTMADVYQCNRYGVALDNVREY